MSGKHILILFHARTKERELKKTSVIGLVKYWREAGYRVTFQFGIKSFIPADIVFVHVDLSVVPNEYLEFAARYPIAINGEIKDIRKTVISENLVKLNDDWQGAVIVKSDLNYAGEPEYLLSYRRHFRHNILTRGLYQSQKETS